LVFKPGFGISTPWAYAQLAAQAPASYLPEVEAEGALTRWLEDPQAAAETLLLNSMEPPAFRKFVALPTLLDQLGKEFGLAPRLSGSGSACYALLPNSVDAGPVIAAVREAWGESAFVLDTRLL
jgi:4-diphosphocytidyl-2-C-methyl-D-erythritol kinase